MTLPVPPEFAGPTDGDGSGNYPGSGHAWSGQPLRSPPAAPYFVPATGIAAEEVNYEFGVFADFLAGAYALDVAMPALNWTTLQIGGVAFATKAATTGANWDALNKRWMVCAGDAAGTSANNCFSNAGFGDVTDDWLSIDNGGGLGSGCFVDVVNDGTNFIGINATGLSYGGNGAFHVFRTVNGRTANWGTFTLNAGTFAGGRLYLFGGEAYAIFSTAYGSTLLDIFRSVDHGVTWLSVLASTTTGGEDVLVADNGTTMVVMPKNASTGYYTGSVASWTAHTNPFAGQVMQGLVFCGGLFIAITNDLTVVPGTIGVANNTYTYQSADGITWNLVSTVTSFTSFGLAAATGRGTLATITQDLGTGDGTGAIFSALSADFGVTWYRSGFVLPHESGTVIHPAFLRGSPNGFFAAAFTTGRFSRYAGLPASPLT
jgi:hypothetical protein